MVGLGWWLPAPWGVGAVWLLFSNSSKLPGLDKQEPEFYMSWSRSWVEGSLVLLANSVALCCFFLWPYERHTSHTLPPPFHSRTKEGDKSESHENSLKSSKKGVAWRPQFVCQFWECIVTWSLCLRIGWLFPCGSNTLWEPVHTPWT